jgi:hypothetical protein
MVMPARIHVGASEAIVQSAVAGHRFDAAREAEHVALDLHSAAAHAADHLLILPRIGKGVSWDAGTDMLHLVTNALGPDGPGHLWAVRADASVNRVKRKQVALSGESQGHPRRRWTVAMVRE